jgi:RNA-splicing ligase RtcB
MEGYYENLMGNEARAILFSEDIEDACMDQIVEILNNKFLAEEHIAIMPDCHAGNNVCIGFTSTMKDWAVPNYIGVDIGCGVAACKLKTKEVDFAKFDRHVRKTIPFGMSVHKRFDEGELKEVFKEAINGSFYSFCKSVKDIVKFYKLNFRDEWYVEKSIGTLGGGNHFIEIDRNSSGELFLAVHSGSRNFGLKIANHFQKLVGEKGYLSGTDLHNYIDCMDNAQVYAQFNRAAMLARMLEFFGEDYSKSNVIESVHNYIDLDNKIIRKGAISAQKDEMCIIPINMADGILLCKGKGNELWNYSAPHGAGRLFGRNQAKKKFSVEEYEFRMKEKGVWSSCVSSETLDESPMAYKPIDYITRHIQDTVDVVDRWRSVYNFKASE